MEFKYITSDEEIYVASNMMLSEFLSSHYGGIIYIGSYDQCRATFETGIYFDTKTNMVYKKHIETTENRVLSEQITKIGEFKLLDKPKQSNKISNEIYTILSQKPSYLEFIEEQTTDMCWFAIVKDPKVIEFVKNPTFGMCKYVLERDYTNISKIKNQTEELCMMVARFGTLEGINNPSTKVCIKAIQNLSGGRSSIMNLMNTIKDKNNEIYRAILTKDPYYLNFINDPSIDIQKIAIESTNNLDYTMSTIKNQTDEIYKIALCKDPNFIKKIKNPSIALQKIALDIDVNEFTSISNPSEEIKEYMKTKLNIIMKH